jgi:hypothetical protein
LRICLQKIEYNHTNDTDPRLWDKIRTHKGNWRTAGLGARADYFDMNIRGKIDTLMQKRISDHTDRSRTCRRPYLKSITGYQEDIGRTNDGGACLTLFYMKTVRQLTLTFITALFVVTSSP